MAGPSRPAAPDAPLVTVVVTCFNYADYVAGALDSVLAQDYPALEVIAVDDGSNDGSDRVLAAYEDRIRVLRHERNRGQPASLNTGLAAARGKFILFFDADDIMLPGAVSAAVEAWSEGVSRVAFQLREVDADLNSLGRMAEEGDPAACDPRRVRSMRDLRTGPPTSGNLYLAAALAPYFPMEERPWRIATDVYCNGLASLSGRLALVRRPLAICRSHGRNLSLRGGYTLARVRELLLVEPAFRRVLSAHGLAEKEIPCISPRHFMLRLSSFLIDRRAHPYPEDTRWSLWMDGVRSALACPWTARPAIMARLTLLALCPSFLARRLLLAGMRHKTRQRNRRR